MNLFPLNKMNNITSNHHCLGSKKKTSALYNAFPLDVLLYGQLDQVDSPSILFDNYLGVWLLVIQTTVDSSPYMFHFVIAESKGSSLEYPSKSISRNLFSCRTEDIDFPEGCLTLNLIRIYSLGAELLSCGVLYSNYLLTFFVYSGETSDFHNHHLYRLLAVFYPFAQMDNLT